MACSVAFLLFTNGLSNWFKRSINDTSSPLLPFSKAKFVANALLLFVLTSSNLLASLATSVSLPSALVDNVLPFLDFVLVSFSFPPVS